MDESKLIRAGYKIIEQEGLPAPKSIRFRYSRNGTRRKLGGCTKYKIDDSYRLNINTSKAVFIPNKKGRYRDTKGIRYARKSQLRTDEEIIDTLAHEIAHLKYWEHGPQHKSYTEAIKLKLRTEVMPNEN
jgi:hypothetical protein